MILLIEFFTLSIEKGCRHSVSLRLASVVNSNSREMQWLQMCSIMIVVIRRRENVHAGILVLIRDTPRKIKGMVSFCTSK